MLGFFPVGAKPLAALPTGPWYVWGEVGDLACVHEEVRLLYVPFENRLAVVRLIQVSRRHLALAFVEHLPRVHRAAIVSGHANLAALAGPLTALGVRAFTRPLTSTEAAPLVAHVRALLDAAAPEAP